tara:strand:+ start:261 stop:446 length:186 start_codon:yes stop_codon:yes gene_type:complete
MIEIVFIFMSYMVGTILGLYWGRKTGHKIGIADCIDQLIEQGFLKYKGPKSNPEILKHNEE